MVNQAENQQTASELLKFRLFPLFSESLRIGSDSANFTVVYYTWLHIPRPLTEIPIHGRKTFGCGLACCLCKHVVDLYAEGRQRSGRRTLTSR